MDKKVTKILITAAFIGLIALLIADRHRQPTNGQQLQLPDRTSELSFTDTGELEAAESKRGRAEYFFRLMRDPATNAIPPNIRTREIEFARRLPTRNQSPLNFKIKGLSEAQDFNWSGIGPEDVGGRTRALGIDQRNSDILLAGGVSGGIWKSIDGGASWSFKTSTIENLSVSSLAQDSNSPDTWYYASGEFIGNSATDQGNRAFYFGTGIYKSTDNGESWSQVANEISGELSFNSQFDFISRIIVSPTSSSVFFSSNGFGIYRSADGGLTFNGPVLGTEGEQRFADVAVASDGTLAGAISADTFGQGGGHNPGVFVSTDDGISWTEITPGSFPGDNSGYGRSVLAFAPSNPDILYVLTFVTEITDGRDDIRLHRINVSTGNSDEFSDRIPNFGEPVGGFWTQQGYDMEIAVKPDDENFVLIGGTNLFRFSDITTASPSDSDGDGLTDDSEKDRFWVGGYAKANDVSWYPNQHPDQHIIAFDPNSAGRMFAGHDAGVSLTQDITANSVTWIDRTQGYITTQFYTMALPASSSDERIMGGTQDNSTIFVRSSNPAQSQIVFGGDGGYTYFAPSYLLVSAQNGQVARLSVDSQNNPTNFGAIVHPRGATEQLFVHPYVLDPNDETVLYYPGSNSNLGRQFIWRNTEIDQISNSNSDGATQGWEQLTNFDVPSGYVISNLAVSKVPADILYFAGSDGDPTDNNNLEPLLFRVNNAKTSTSGKQELFSANIDTSFSGVPRGAYIHNLALNPVNANELLVVMSNYNITGIFHSDDGGQNWSSVEGNLTGDALNPGPSIRSATIIPGETETVYIVATSTGVFSTTTLDGTNTSWVRESPGGIGFAVSEFVTSRSSDGDVAVGTHGRGIFLGEFTGTTITPSFTLTPAQARAGEQVAITASNFTFSSDPLQNSVLFGGQEAVVTEASSNSITVIVPRREQAGGSSSASVEVQISVEGGPTFGGVSFTYIPPEQFELLQNYPNPFNLTTNIPFNLGQRSVVIVQVYDITGRKVIEPISETFDSGSWSQPVNLDGLASGIYFYRVLVFPLDAGGNVVSQSPQIIESKKMTLVK